MLFTNPDMAARIMEERVNDSLRNAEKAQLLREAHGTHIAGPNGSTALLTGVRNLFQSLRPAAQNHSPIKR